MLEISKVRSQSVDCQPTSQDGDELADGKATTQLSIHIDVLLRS